METAPSASSRRAHQQITHALANINKTRSRRFGAHQPISEPKFKQLVLQVFPNASVRRVGSWQGRQLIAVTYECFIGDERIRSKHCTVAHRTPNGAWICLARYAADCKAFNETTGELSP